MTTTDPGSGDDADAADTASDADTDSDGDTPAHADTDTTTLTRPFDFSRFEEGRGTSYWALDPALRAEVGRSIPAAAVDRSTERLGSLGAAVATTVADNADTLDRHPPDLRTYDKHGRVANRVDYHPAQAENERVVVDHGVVRDAFEAPDGRDEPLPFTHSLAACYLLNYADTGLTCPVAMTLGVGLVLSEFDDGSLDRFYDGVVARDHDDWLQGAMFLTEKAGGSDVGATETVAEPADSAAERGEPGSAWRLTGEKWFCSNLDAGAALALARRPDGGDGTSGLGLFLVPRETRDGAPNDFLYRRLKDKLGTRSVPTGEIELRGAEAYLVGDPEAGFRQMASMVNLERLANAMGSMGLVGRALLEATVHAGNRDAFGESLDAHPLMRRDLVEMTVEHEAGLAATFEAARQFDAVQGRGRMKEADDDGGADPYPLMRLLVPVVKYRTARLAVDTASYAMEVLGGNGYVDEFVTNRLLRDAQVLPIWEGASNVLALDVLRVLAREGAAGPLLERVRSRLAAVDSPHLADDVAAVEAAVDDLEATFARLATVDPDAAQYRGKAVADRIYDVVAAACLLDRASDELEGRDDGGDGDARTALVAAAFVDDRFRSAALADFDERVGERFDAVVRHAPVDPERLAALR
ncbi:acyl-CoA dehydrogenase family protein [Halobium salinum]|uniref:Acyl-CoA dehydrogenase family protein n=1 Tax=Halobium salinum TaxID=1364940 RepID=A0ABD5PAY3_9EURY|nr:acyl-CoA dehydrogenase family protein [Halobium salinum]